MNNLTLIDDMLARWPAPTGLYIASGTRDMIPMLERLLARHRSALGAIYWVDSGNSFNAYHLADTARRQGLNPSSLLKSIHIARPFTAFQFQQMIDKIPWSDRPPLVIISDLMSLFFDPEIQEADLRRAFRQFTVNLDQLKKRAVVLSLLINHATPPGRDRLLPQLMSAMGPISEPPPQLVA